MPLLNVTSIPYTGAPTTSSPLSVSGDFQNIQASPEAFGASSARTLSGLGSAFEKAGDSLAAIAIDRQNIFNKVAATEASNQMQDRLNSILYGDPNIPGDTGFHGKQGRNALDAYPSARDNINKAFDQARSGLQNPIQQLLFDSEMRRQRAYSLSDIGRHYDAQFKQYATDQSVAEQKLGVQQAVSAAAAGDYGRFNEGLAKSITSIYAQGQRDGWSQEKIDEKVQEVRISGVREWIKALSVTAPNDALSFLENNKDALAAGEYAAIEHSLREEAAKERADRAARGENMRGQRFQPDPGAVAPNEVQSYLGTLGASSNETALLTSAAESESGFNPNQTHDGGIGFGLFGHNGSRLAAMKREAGTDKPTWQQQVKFALNELRSRPEGSRVNSAKTASELTDLQLEYEQPKIPQRAERLTATERYMVNTATAPTALAPPGTVALTAVGDSIAVQQLPYGVTGKADAPFKSPTQALLPGFTAGVGDSTTRVAARIASLPKSQIQGQIVFNSTGASNSPDDLAPVAAQLQELHNKGAAQILVPGVGPGVKNSSKVNTELARIAGENHALFFVPKIKWQKDGIHPASAKEMQAEALRVLKESSGE